METCVLIPQEFALAVTGVGARNSREQTATVWSNTAIPQGTVCYPFQGTVRIDNLDLYSYVDEDDRGRFDKEKQGKSAGCEEIGRKAHPPMT
ncbi:hypothetical protein quinque_011808 [Culex quinquefasciatus]